MLAIVFTVLLASLCRYAHPLYTVFLHDVLFRKQCLILGKVVESQCVPSALPLLRRSTLSTPFEGPVPNLFSCLYW